MRAVVVNTRIKFICILPEKQMFVVWEDNAVEEKIPKKDEEKDENESDSAFGSEFTFFGGI